MSVTPLATRVRVRGATWSWVPSQKMENKVVVLVTAVVALLLIYLSVRQWEVAGQRLHETKRELVLLELLRDRFRTMATELEKRQDDRFREVEEKLKEQCCFDEALWDY